MIPGVDIDDATDIAIGSHKAANLIQAVREERVTPDHAWLVFVELGARSDWRSGLCRAFVIELAKRASQAEAGQE